MSIGLKPTSQTIYCTCLCLTISLHPTHDIYLHVCSGPWDTKPGLLCRLDSTTCPCYLVSSKPLVRQMLTMDDKGGWGLAIAKNH